MNRIVQQLDSMMTASLRGTVAETLGMLIAVADFPAPLGAVASIDRQAGGSVSAEVVGFRGGRTLVYPFDSMEGIRRGSHVRMERTARTLPLGTELLGRVIDAHGRAIDERPQPVLPDRAALEQPAIPPVRRPPIDKPLATGVRAIDGLLTCGKGQRMGIFSGSGVGKSVMLGMMARRTTADVNVIALIGERGREVNQFIERDLGPAGLARSVVVVATSDEPALKRMQAAYAATTVAEYFRDQGNDVLLLMDSVTRFAMAAREIGLSAGEPPTTRGYPPSVFTLLPRLVERTGRSPSGSITAFYSVLVEGDDAQEPIADTMRGVLDGHTWLSRSIASRGHYPAIDVLESISRLMIDVAPPAQREAAARIRELSAAYRDHEDLISIGAYRRGSNPLVDTAIAALDEINGFLRQGVDEVSSLEATQQALLALAAKCEITKPPAPVA